MKNAHLRFGWLTYIKSTEKTTSIRLHLDRFIGELSADPQRQAKAHLISVIGGDTQIAAISAAISVSDRFMVEGPGVQAMRVCLERNAEVFKGSIPLTGRKKPLRHLVALSEEFAANGGSASSGKILLASSDRKFVWSSISEVYGIPGIPEWADWFAEELTIQQAIAPAVGIGCHPAIVQGNKEQFLDWLSWGVESNAIQFPAADGSIVWPGLALDCIFK
jgi:hypothetical protein